MFVNSGNAVLTFYGTASGVSPTPSANAVNGIPLVIRTACTLGTVTADLDINTVTPGGGFSSPGTVTARLMSGSFTAGGGALAPSSLTTTLFTCTPTSGVLSCSTNVNTSIAANTILAWQLTKTTGAGASAMNLMTSVVCQ